MVTKQRLVALCVFVLLGVLFSITAYGDSTSVTIVSQNEQNSKLKELLNKLNDPKFEVRRAAIFDLGLLGDIRAVDPLLQTLQDKDSNILAYVMYALGRLKDKKAIEPLKQFLQNPDISLRLEAFRTLLSIGYNSTPDIVLSFTAPTTPIGARLEAIKTLGRIARPEAYEALTNALDDANPQVREAAAKALATRHSDALSLILALKDKDSKIREDAAKKLGRFWCISNPIIPRDLNVQADAVMPDPVGSPALIKALKDDNVDVRYAVIEALIELKDSRALPALEEAAKNDTGVTRQGFSISLSAKNAIQKRSEVQKGKDEGWICT